MNIILEPCCKIRQFNQILQTLKKSTAVETAIGFTHYGDVAFTDWFTLLILETKGSDVCFRLETLDLSTLNYILNRMQNHAFIPGKNLHLFNHVTISARNMPEYIPLRGKVLQEEGRLIIKTKKRKTTFDRITITPPEATKPEYIIQGNFFAEKPNAPRTITIIQLYKDIHS